MHLHLLTAILLLPTFQAQETLAQAKGQVSHYLENGVERTLFRHEATGAAIDYVKNSGICETTPGVNQYSGYLSVGTDENMWFWFFEARNNPRTAPLAAWFNGGPGCSSMIGLFQENGPCHFVNGSNETSLNPYSWNEYANMIYIDQPIGVGFSYGNNTVNSTVSAAPLVWKLIQVFYDQFPQYENRDFGIFTESYGGHYGPEFASYFQSQNLAINSGSIDGHEVNLKALAINNGWFDATIQEKAYIDFSLNNTYGALITPEQYGTYLDAYYSRCLPALNACSSLTGNDSACSTAYNVCYETTEGPLSEVKDFDVYDIRAPRNDPNPPNTYENYLRSPAVITAIGAKSTYQSCPEDPYRKFSETGDLQTNLTTLIWAGDADWICNWMGVLATAETITYPQAEEFRTQPEAEYLVNGNAGGKFKVAGNLNWLRVYGAGHEVPFYTPELSLQVFQQIMTDGRISSTEENKGKSELI
ncbi:Carboxypeptidase [Podosphaera aphanis]|nr:Carboxypeptidase [Podosphaera aphanis]